MGRKKLEMKRIEDKSSRQVTFYKRRNGLMKKAKQLSVLCDVHLALLASSSRGKLYEFSSGDNLKTILQRYHSHHETKGKISKYANETEGSFLTRAELLQIANRHLEGPNNEEPSIAELMQMEEQLAAALIQTRSRKTQLLLESVSVLQEKERLLTEENKHLEGEIAARVKNDNKANEEVENNHLNCHPSSTMLNLF